MVNRPPDFCPYCGGELVPVDPPTTHRCDACEDYVFHNPIPQSRVAVVDGDRVLFVEIPDDGVTDLWTTPGGAIEAGEDPTEAAARELEEETGLSADPADFQFFDARIYTKFEDTHKTALLYAVDRAATTGPMELGAEHSDARFFAPGEFRAAGLSLAEFDDRDDRFRDPAWWRREARAAIETGRALDRTGRALDRTGRALPTRAGPRCCASSRRSPGRPRSHPHCGGHNPGTRRSFRPA
jgi:8-oxo-dGTP pyrophosphatase MutT (NUDIX family)